VVIAIDGPAGAGKSTVAKRVAEMLGHVYLDTGAMYRAFTLYVIEKKIPLEDIEKIRKSLDNFSIRMNDDRVFVNGIDVTQKIRSDVVTDTVSYISSLDFIRKKMVELQRNISENKDIVAEGRDIGTIVFPNTKYKFYLDASIEERAHRRLYDQNSSSSTNDLSAMSEKIKKRDAYDSSRPVSPLKRADDAYYIDSTNMSITEVCNTILRRVIEISRGALHHGESE
jgi:cytidylate kinase